MLDLRTLAHVMGGEIRGSRVVCPGPNHSSADRSLSIKLSSTAPEGFVVHSFAGDNPMECRDYVRDKAALDNPFEPRNRKPRRQPRASKGAIERALIAVVNGPEPKGTIVASYDYTDSDGALLYQALRLEPKNFQQRRPDGNGGWIWKLGDVRRVLYRWPEILKYPYGTVFICEGEKDADRVASLGHCATTVASGKWTDDCVAALAGRDCLILEDNDAPGRKKALETATKVHTVANTIRIVSLPNLPDGGDVSDWLDADERRVNELVDVCLNSPLWEPVT